MSAEQNSALQSDRPWEGLPLEALPAFAPHLDSVADEIVQTIAREVPAYARPLEGAFGEGMQRGVAEALEQFNAMVRNPGSGRAPGRELYMELGRGEAREGRSLEALLAAYRVGARVAWRRLSTLGLEAGFAPEVLVLFAESIFAYIDELSAESAEGFAEEQAARAGEADRRRAALLDLLLRDPPADPAALGASADAARWRIPPTLALLVWPAEAGLRPASQLPLGSMASPREGLVCAAIPDPDAPGRRQQLAHALAGVPSALGTTVAPADAARSLARAVPLLGLAGERPEPVMLAADEHRVELLLRADPSLAAEMAALRLAPLEAETELSRERLRATLLAWLRHDGNVAAAAEELHVHVQTVRYRLTRLRDLFGAALEDPDSRFELEIALRSEKVNGAG